MPSYRGELRLPNKHAIAATHQGAADSNEAPPRRGRGAANAEAWRGDGVASASCDDGRVDDVALLSEAGRAAFQIGALRRALSRARVVACQKLWGSPSGRLVCAQDVGHRPNHQLWRITEGFCLVGLSTVLSMGIGGFRSAFDLCSGLLRQGRVPGHCDIQASRTGRGTVGSRRVRVRVHSTLVLSRVGKDKDGALFDPG